MTQQRQPPVCDYEGSDYRTRFWENQGRDYEDQAERRALRRLLPPKGSTLIDIGAGFGRLVDEYQGYERIVLFDFSRTLLREAQARLGNDQRFIYVAGNWYDMPFIDAVFDAMVQVRTIHHAADVPTLLSELARIAAPGGQYILEFANKRNLKAILRFLLRRQEWSPFDHQPVEFVPLNFDFHPAWIHNQLQVAGFKPHTQYAVSHFRVPLLKKIAPANSLAALDALLQPTGRWLQFTPSVFIASSNPVGTHRPEDASLFACPRCRGDLGEAESEIGALTCPQCAAVWRVEDGLYDFKEPAS